MYLANELAGITVKLISKSGGEKRNLYNQRKLLSTHLGSFISIIQFRYTSINQYNFNMRFVNSIWGTIRCLIFVCTTYVKLIKSAAVKDAKIHVIIELNIEEEKYKFQSCHVVSGIYITV